MGQGAKCGNRRKKGGIRERTTRKGSGGNSAGFTNVVSCRLKCGDRRGLDPYFLSRSPSALSLLWIFCHKFVGPCSAEQSEHSWKWSGNFWGGGSIVPSRLIWWTCIAWLACLLVECSNAVLVYTMQSVLQPVVKPIVQPILSCTRRSRRSDDRVKHSCYISRYHSHVSTWCTALPECCSWCGDGLRGYNVLLQRFAILLSTSIIIIFFFAVCFCVRMTARASNC